MSLMFKFIWDPGLAHNLNLYYTVPNIWFWKRKTKVKFVSAPLITITSATATKF